MNIIFIRDYFCMQCGLWLCTPHLQSQYQKHWTCGFASSFETHEMYCTSTDCMLFIDFVRAHGGNSRHHVALINRNKITAMLINDPSQAQMHTYPDSPRVWTAVTPMGHDDEGGLTGIEGHRDADAETMDGIMRLINYQIPIPANQTSSMSGNKIMYNIYWFW